MSTGRRRYESEFMNRELTKSFPERSDSKIGRRSLLGMTIAGLAGSLVACATNSQARSTTATSAQNCYLHNSTELSLENSHIRFACTLLCVFLATFENDARQRSSYSRASDSCREISANVSRCSSSICRTSSSVSAANSFVRARFES